MLVHNSHLPFYRSPQNSVPCETMVTFRFVSDEAKAVKLRLWNGREAILPMRFDGTLTYSVSCLMPKNPCVMWYDFLVQTVSGEISYGNAVDQLGGEGSVQGYDRHSFQITVYTKNYSVPPYMHEANIYQIFPDRFFKAPTKSVCRRTDRYIHKNWDETPILIADPVLGGDTNADFFGGTLNGIKEKLPCLKTLGINLLYLNPIFQSRSNHRYDTGDYSKTDPLLGTNEEFKALCDAAKALDMRVMLDGVFSHTGSDSLYFNKDGHYPFLGAYQSKKSEYYEWYEFMDYPTVYQSWWGFQTLPEVNKASEKYRRFMFNGRNGIVPLWIKKGAAGWRLDVADELPMDFLRQLRVASKKAAPDAVVLGEVWEDASNKITYGETRCYCLGDTLDSVMNYPLRETLIAFLKGDCNAFHLARLIRHQQEVYPVPFFYALMNLIGSHDRARAVNTLVGRTYENLPAEERGYQRLSDEEYALGVKRLMKAYDILCVLPGAPAIYYGDEAGLQGGPDPFCRGTFPWGRENAALRAHVKMLLTRRNQDNLLTLGKLHICAKNDDTLEITRFFDGEDAFHTPQKNRRVTFEISRKG